MLQDKPNRQLHLRPRVNRRVEMKTECQEAKARDISPDAVVVCSSEPWSW